MIENTQELGTRWRAAVTSVGRFVEIALAPLAKAIPDLDLTVTIRRGRIRVKPEPLYLGEGWKDQ